jgi:hypothetical protein
MPREMKATMHHQGHLVQQVSARKQQQQQQQWQKQQQSSKIVFPQKALNVPTALASSASPASPQITGFAANKQKASTKQSLLKYVGLGSLGKSPTKSPTKTPTKTVDTPESKELADRVKALQYHNDLLLLHALHRFIMHIPCTSR